LERIIYRTVSDNEKRADTAIYIMREFKITNVGNLENFKIA